MDYLLDNEEKKEAVLLSDFLHEKPVLLVLLRHLGGPICRNFLAQLREHAATIETNGVSLVAIVPADTAQLRQFLDVYGPYPFTILGDPKQQAYKDLQLGKISAAKSGKVLIQYLLSGRMREIFPKDRKQASIVRKAMVSQDVYQLGGTWLIDTTGEVLWRHIDKAPADHATIPQILEVLHDANRHGNRMQACAIFLPARWQNSIPVIYYLFMNGNGLIPKLLDGNGPFYR